MDTEQAALELHHPDALALLRSAALARLAYTGRDGLPRVIPIGFYWNGTAVVVCTAPITEGSRPVGPAAGRTDDRHGQLAGSVRAGLRPRPPAQPPRPAQAGPRRCTRAAATARRRLAARAGSSSSCRAHR